MTVNMDRQALPGADKGFTKRERAAIDLLVPDSGDRELDGMIKKACDCDHQRHVNLLDAIRSAGIRAR